MRETDKSELIEWSDGYFLNAVQEDILTSKSKYNLR